MHNAALLAQDNIELCTVFQEEGKGINAPSK
jgi:hypothetical protein